MVLPASVKMQMDESRDYPDLHLEYALEQSKTAHFEFCDGS